MVEKCDSCGKERDYEVDKVNYHPVQVIRGEKLGWYNGSDGILCGDCMTRILNNQ